VQMTVNQLIAELERHRDVHGRGNHLVVTATIGLPGRGTVDVVAGEPESEGNIVRLLGRRWTRA
jgi:hypothetical protein